MIVEHFAICGADGAVRGRGSCPPGRAIRQLPPEPGGVIALVDEATHDALERPWEFRLLGGAVVPREAMAASADKTTILADGLDAAVVSGFPAGCTVAVAGPGVAYGPVLQAASGDDDPLEISLSVPGTVTVTLRRDPTHTPWKVQIHGTA